ncbi:E3 SUMO-protein ligase ZBED1-like isoform X2 [Hydra vulgaris]|uniref:E3 SUMO-protein ligase ZBED1-like isoform X2 n=1 Tax=Hydra vulgaris TaxID=6087 RepID=A0ABM4CRY1_HYDVU
MCIKSVLQLKEAIKTLAKSNEEFARSCPSDDQWKTLEYSMPFLEKIYNISVGLSADKRPTIQDVIPELYSLHQELLAQQNHKDKATRISIKMLISELQERYPLNGAEQLINCYANFLDPRYKGLHLIEYKKIDDIKEALLTQEKAKKKEKLPITSSKIDNESNPNTKVNHHELLKKRLKQDISARSASTTTKLSLEIEHYLGAETADEKTNVLEWWKIMKLQYPILSDYAQKYLCITASSATSERVFSTAGNVVTARRTTLAIENVEKIVYIKENIKKIKINL